MRNQKLYESVRKYIDKYYIYKPDDIKLDKEMKSIFDRISEFRKKKTAKKCDAVEDADIEIDESAVESFDVESIALNYEAVGRAVRGITKSRNCSVELDDAWAEDIAEYHEKAGKR